MLGLFLHYNGVFHASVGAAHREINYKFEAVDLINTFFFCIEGG